MNRFEGKIALVSGPPRGQGKRHAKRLSEEGAAIVAVDIFHQIHDVQYDLASPEDVRETVNAVGPLGRRALSLACDVRS